ncbi:hypothetical protein H7X69_02855, partial [Candidatus Saccharibacteria bacterium]|nr:hypothetical protein [Candidatus Saccharibacteria bacterium]
ECAARFVADDTLSVLQLNGHIKEAQSINLLWLRFAGLSQNMYAKAASLLSIWHVRTGESNVMYSSLVFMQQQGGPKVMDVSCRYEGSLVVATMPMPQPRSAFLSFPIMWWGALAPALFLLAYFFYIAATLQSSSLLILSWLILTIWLLAAVLSDEASKVFEKIRLTFCLPALYFLLYAQLVIYAVMRIVRAVALAAFGQTLVHRQGTWLAERKL